VIVPTGQGGSADRLARVFDDFWGPLLKTHFEYQFMAGAAGQVRESFRVTRLGRRHKAEDVVKTTNPRGEVVYWVGAAGPAADAGEGTDFNAIEAGYVSITPLQIDLTNRDQMPSVARWVER